jgi:hypothetical protein
LKSLPVVLLVSLLHLIEDNAEIKAWLAMGTKTKKKGGGKKKKGLSCKYKAVLHAETLISFYGLSSNW